MMLRKNFLMLLLLSVFITGCASNYHSKVDKIIEESSAHYEEGKKRTLEALKKKNKEKVRTIDIDLDELNKLIDDTSLNYVNPTDTNDVVPDENNDSFTVLGG